MKQFFPLACSFPPSLLQHHPLKTIVSFPKTLPTYNLNSHQSPKKKPMLLAERCNYLGLGSGTVAEKIYNPLSSWKLPLCWSFQRCLSRRETLDAGSTARFAFPGGLKFMLVLYYLNVFSLGEQIWNVASERVAKLIMTKSAKKNYTVKLCIIM